MSAPQITGFPHDHYAWHIREIDLVRLIAFDEGMIAIAEQWYVNHRDAGRSQEARNWFDRRQTSANRHAALAAVYEARFGDIPRLPLGILDTRPAGHWTLSDAYMKHRLPPLPEVRLV